MIPNELPSLDFDLGETADMLRASVLSFSSDEIAPRAAEIDETREGNLSSAIRVNVLKAVLETTTI